MVFLEDLEDMDMRIPTKKEVGVFRQPPKLKGKHFRNMEYLADASLTWLTPNETKSFPSEVYDDSLDTSYFEQCFKITTKLGEGSFGSVMKVLSKTDSQHYAIKVSKEPFKSDNDRTQKLTEVKNLKQFSFHPNIVTLYEAWEEDRHLYLQMELCLFSLDKVEGPMSCDQCLSVLADILAALSVIHEQGIGHFDVKPENIQLGMDKLYKLADFGLAYDFIMKTEKVPIEGDAKYLAPELLSIKNQFSSKADIFSLAITTVELAGNLSLPSNGKVWRALRNGSLPKSILSNISVELFSILEVMMLPNPEERPRAGEVLQYPLVKQAYMKDPKTRMNPSMERESISISTESTSLSYLVTSTPFIEGVSRAHDFTFPTPSPVQGDMMDTSENPLTTQPSNRGNYFGIASDILADVSNISYASPSALKLGFSPVRLSNQLKADVKAKKRRFSMRPRNLTDVFKDEGSLEED